MADTAVLTIEVDHPDRCHAAKCKVPAHTDIIVLMSADGGRKFEQRVCLGHLMALRALVDRLARHVPIRMMTPEDITRMQAQPRVVFNMTSTTTTAGYGGTYAFFYR